MVGYSDGDVMYKLLHMGGPVCYSVYTTASSVMLPDDAGELANNKKERG